MKKLTRRLAAGLALAVGVSMAGVGWSATALASDGPSGFVYGTDSLPVSGTGSAPYQEPHIGGQYGGYIGMAGNWARTEGCNTGNFLDWSSANSAQANTNYSTYHLGIGTGVYWYMGGPGVDPHYNGTTAEAGKWGADQASLTLAAMTKLHVTYPVVWADIELPGILPAPDNGWNNVYTSPCSRDVKHAGIAATVDRAEFNAYASYITSHSKYKVGVYSSLSVWESIFGPNTRANTVSQIPNTYVWSYEPESSHLSAAPVGCCLRGTNTCAKFFGGQNSSSKYALMWQWSGGGGVSNGYGDFDQIDEARMK